MRLDVRTAKRRKELWLLDCQSVHMSALETRFTIPLVRLNPQLPPASRLHPVFVINGEQRMLLTNQAASLPQSELGGLVASLAHEDIAVSNALDLMLHGF